MGYMFTLIASMVDDQIPLTNDKGDIAFKGWEDICRHSSNFGRTIFSLQKLRGFLDKKEPTLK